MMQEFHRLAKDMLQPARILSLCQNICPVMKNSGLRANQQVKEKRIQHDLSVLSHRFCQGKRVSFYKRAQILVADFWGIMEARGEGDIVDMDWLTMFADYRVPQALVYLGVLRYSDALMQALKAGEEAFCKCNVYQARCLEI